MICYELYFPLVCRLLSRMLGVLSLYISLAFFFFFLFFFFHFIIIFTLYFVLGNLQSTFPNFFYLLFFLVALTATMGAAKKVSPKKFSVNAQDFRRRPMPFCPQCNSKCVYCGLGYNDNGKGVKEKIPYYDLVGHVIACKNGTDGLRSAKHGGGE